MERKQYERVQSYIRKGIAEGAEVLVGGEGHPRGFEAGNFVKPTVFVNVTNDMTIAREEIFGPVLCVLTYDTEEEAIEIANDSDYGLHGWVSGTDLQRARGGLPAPRGPRGDQRHAGRPTSAVRRIQTLGCRARVWHPRDRGLSRAEGHPRVIAASAARRYSTDEEGFRLIIDMIPGLVYTLSPAGELESVTGKSSIASAGDGGDPRLGAAGPPRRPGSAGPLRPLYHNRTTGRRHRTRRTTSPAPIWTRETLPSASSFQFGRRLEPSPATREGVDPGGEPELQAGVGEIGVGLDPRDERARAMPAPTAFHCR